MPTTIGFLATGNEVCDGDIVNTNTPQLAQLFVDHGWQIGHTLCVPDDEQQILDGLSYLASKHDVIITIGGLGPTKDDITRNALSRFTDQPLVFNEDSWQRICNRFQKRDLLLTENNRQQAYFPENATVLSNGNGSADSCYLTYQNKLFFMLPGPPKECLGVMHDHVLPRLDCHPKLVRNNQILLKWYLLGVSEAHIATDMEALLADIDCTTGYRADYPYLEFKVWINDPEQQSTVQALVDHALASYCVMPTQQTASAYAQEYVLDQQFPNPVYVIDVATSGILQTRLVTQKTYQVIRFIPSPYHMTNTYAIVRGLDGFWPYEGGQEPYSAPWDPPPPSISKKTTVKILFSHFLHGTEQFVRVEKTFPLGNDTLHVYVAEWVCYEWVKWLKTVQDDLHAACHDS